jgi:shikimate dehydrogenase
LKINADTKITGILGFPVKHSFSPVMQNAAFLAEGINVAYLAFSVHPDHLERAVEGVRSLGMLGVNVTIPHKERVVPLVDWISPEVALTGALNTIVNQHGRLLGYNTDPYGFLQSLQEEKIALRGKEAILIGSGGAARGVVVALQKLGCKRILIFNRGRGRARKLIEDLSLRSQTDLQSYPLRELGNSAVFKNAAIVINSTPVGLRGESFFPLNYQATPPPCVFWDLIYHTERTAFLMGAMSAGRPVHNGLSMLLHQGARSFTLWTHRKAPLSVMQNSLKNAVEGSF